jgi:hypothetical protein
MSGDLLIVKYNPQGQVLMAKTAGGENEDRIDCISINNNGDIYITGMVSGNASFDAITTTAPSFTAYPFLAKVTQGTLGTDDLYLTEAVLYPNPADQIINISGVALNTNATIYNLPGQEIFNFKITDKSIPVDVLAPGTYIVKIEGYRPLQFIKR